MVEHRAYTSGVLGSSPSTRIRFCRMRVSDTPARVASGRERRSHVPTPVGTGEAVPRLLRATASKKSRESPSTRIRFCRMRVSDTPARVASGRERRSHVPTPVGTGEAVPRLLRATASKKKLKFIRSVFLLFFFYLIRQRLPEILKDFHLQADHGLQHGPLLPFLYF